MTVTRRVSGETEAVGKEGDWGTEACCIIGEMTVSGVDNSGTLEAMAGNSVEGSNQKTRTVGWADRRGREHPQREKETVAKGLEGLRIDFRK